MSDYTAKMWERVEVISRRHERQVYACLLFGFFAGFLVGYALAKS